MINSEHNHVFNEFYENDNQCDIGITSVPELETKLNEEEIGYIQHYKCWQHRHYVTNYVTRSQFSAICWTECFRYWRHRPYVVSHRIRQFQGIKHCRSKWHRPHVTSVVGRDWLGRYLMNWSRSSLFSHNQSNHVFGFF